MPINFITGLPRSGKTLWTLTQIRARAEKENRQVYYCNIPEVTIPGWIEIDHPDKWLELPDGAIILVDELQDFWGRQPTGAKVPAPILELSKHGKRGFDFYFITQEPDLVHATPRGLCQFHYYVIRAFGANACVIYKFDRMQTRPEKVKSKGEKFPWKYNTDAFTWYKSADVHNIKREIPRKLIALPFVALLAVGAIWAAVSFFSSTTDKAKSNAQRATPAGAAQPAGAQPGQSGKPVTMTAYQYVESYQPRLPGLMHTAPAYDELTKPKVVPVPAACMESQSAGCKCWTQQATPYDTSEDLCRQIVKSGIFLAFLPNGDQQQPAAAPRDQQVRPDVQQVAVEARSGPILIDAPGKAAAPAVAPPTPSAQPRVQPGSKWSFTPGA